MKKLVQILSLALVLMMVSGICLTAYASSSSQVQGLKDYLEENLGSTPVKSSVSNDIDGFYNILYLVDDENYSWVGVYANGSGIDAALVGDDEETKNTVMNIFLNTVGKMLKLAKEYGVTDTNIVFLYETDAETVGVEKDLCIVANIDDDTLYFTADAFYGYEGTSATISELYDSNYDF